MTDRPSRVLHPWTFEHEVATLSHRRSQVSRRNWTHGADDRKG
jgi:hypothetical protein